jgi:O-antigen ligase
MALGLLALTGLLAESVVAVGPQAFVLPPRMAAFLVIGAIVAVVALANDPAWSFSAALAASMFSGRWVQLGVPLPADRLLFALGVAGLLVRLPIQRPTLPRLRFVHAVVAAAAIFALVSAHISGSLSDSGGRYALLDRFGLVPFLSFLLAPVVFDTARRRAILLGVLAACGAYLGVTALAEGIGARALVWPRYILNPNVGIHPDRARGPFVEAGEFGLALWSCAVVALIHVGRPAVRPWLRTAGAIVAGLCIVGLVFTLTRAVWVAAAASAVITLVAARELRRFVIPALICGVLLVAGVLAAVPDLTHKIHEREQTQTSVWDRLNSNAAAVRMLEAKPLAGFGWNSFRQDSPPYYRIAATYPLTSVGVVHNVYLSNLAELGLFGTALWFVALAVAVGAPLVRPPPPELRLWRVGLVAIAVMWLVTANFAPLAAVFPNLLLWTWAGVLWARPERAP